MEQYEYLFEEKELEYEDPGDAGEKVEEEDEDSDGAGKTAEKDDDEDLL